MLLHDPIVLGYVFCMCLALTHHCGGGLALLGRAEFHSMCVQQC